MNDRLVTDRVEDARSKLKTLANTVKTLADTVGDETTLLTETGVCPLNECFRMLWLSLNTVTTDLLLAKPISYEQALQQIRRVDQKYGPFHEFDEFREKTKQ